MSLSANLPLFFTDQSGKFLKKLPSNLGVVSNDGWLLGILYKAEVPLFCAPAIKKFGM
jgi:hypothetical protein